MANPPPPGDEAARVRAKILAGLAEEDGTRRVYVRGGPIEALCLVDELRAALSPAAPASGGTPELEREQLRAVSRRVKRAASRAPLPAGTPRPELLTDKEGEEAVDMLHRLEREANPYALTMVIEHFRQRAFDQYRASPPPAEASTPVAWDVVVGELVRGGHEELAAAVSAVLHDMDMQGSKS